MWNQIKSQSDWTSGNAVGLAMVLLVAGMMSFGVGCGGEEEPIQFVPQDRADRGESCTTRNDCREGLACVSSTCVENEYNISQEAGHCELLECQEADDCCTFPPCNDFTCIDNQCIQDTDDCSVDDDCGFNAICDGGNCVECATDNDCEGADQQCIDGFCDEGCSYDAECPLFHECGGNGECSYVGCQTDRECVLFANNHRAECGSDGCTVPCDNDAECNTGQTGFFQTCNSGICEFVGCDTDAECRAAYDLEHEGDYIEAVCR